MLQNKVQMSIYKQQTFMNTSQSWAYFLQSTVVIVLMESIYNSRKSIIATH